MRILVRFAHANRHSSRAGDNGRGDQSTSDAPIFIADQKGYFRDEGLDVKVTNFR